MLRYFVPLFLLFSVGVTAIESINGVPSRIIDGDTFVLNGERIRLCGIDAPEVNTKFGKSAKIYLDRMIGASFLWCNVVGSGTPCDGRSRSNSYNRYVAQCFSSGGDVACAMVRSGYASDYKRYSGGYYRDC